MLARMLIDLLLDLSPRSGELARETRQHGAIDQDALALH
jgi:hypothetical protein